MSRTAACLVAIIALLVFAPAAFAQSSAGTQGQRGQAEYEKYCAACHGLSGDGQGPAAAALKTPPTDLTQLGARYGTPLPKTKLVAFIDGRRPLTAHGDREMPIWGEKLWKDLPSRTPESRKRSTMLVIIDYLDTLQATD